MIYVLRGCQGCGKSTYAQTLAEKTGAYVLSSDSIRSRLFDDVYYPNIDSVVFEIIRYIVAKENKDFIIDCTNLKSDDELLDFYMLRDKECVIIDVNKDLPLYKVLEQNENRDNIIPKERVIEFYNKWQTL